jgi:dolichol-phosphate mannosyltransferase
VITTKDSINSLNVTIVIPAFNVEAEIEAVLRAIPLYVDHIIVVEDASTDGTKSLVKTVAKTDPRIVLVSHDINKGVGGATISGYQKALLLNTDVVVKLDGDGQMDPQYLPELIAPIVENKADYTKGNRFYDFIALRKMPLIRRIGNTLLGFLCKASTGYWNIFDPTNGFTAIHTKKLKLLNLEKIDKSFYFEISMLANLYLINSRVVDVPIPAIYNEETSNLKIHRVAVYFPFRLTSDFLRRMVFKYFLYDFSMASVYFLAGIPMILFGAIFGAIKWIDYATRAVPAPTGTVILPMMCVLLGIQFLLSAIHIDIQSMPK